MNLGVSSYSPGIEADSLSALPNCLLFTPFAFIVIGATEVSSSPSASSVISSRV
jgi:hypothetical protein